MRHFRVTSYNTIIIKKIIRGDFFWGWHIYIYIYIYMHIWATVSLQPALLGLNKTFFHGERVSKFLRLVDIK